tara:strand:+ start:10134 stop:11006 length:873 start_codon:yes stop_codon:yes gene_type:complete
MNSKVTIISTNLRGILYMLLGTFFLIAMTVIVRNLSSDLHPFEIAFFRNIIGLIMLLPILLKRGFVSLKTNNIGGMALRGIFHAGGMLFYFLALTLIPLADLASLSFTSPLLITLLAVLIFHEKLGPRRIVGLILGFIGALIILRPGSGILGLGAVYALIAVFSWSIAVILIKYLSRDNSTVTMTIYALFFLTLFTFIPALYFWQWPTLEQFWWLIFLAGLGTIGQLLFTQSMKIADVSLIMPFDFSRLIWASLFGIFFFSENPSIWTFVGGGLIFGSATYIAYRERLVK